jgi:hypothetical protein
LYIDIGEQPESLLPQTGRDVGNDGIAYRL